MNSCWRIFWLELTALVRSRTWQLLMLGALVWMWLAPRVLTGDGTVEGARELQIHYSLGGVFALVVVSLLAAATGSIANEREARRLQLTLIRPVRRYLIVWMKFLALLSVGASVLAVSSLMLVASSDRTIRCNHVLSPILPSPRVEAERMYEVYMKDPHTPERVRRAKRSAVVRLLTQKAIDHYQTVPTNAVTSWRFADSGEESVRVRMRFTNNFELRQELLGRFKFGGAETTVSNMTQAVLTLPLNVGAEPRTELKFRNEGKSALMLRPRRDLNLLVPADAFAWNVLRAWLELTAILGIVIAFGLFLSAGLGRPVAIFVAFSALALSEMSPSVVEQYPDEFGASLADRVGLAITRVTAEVTRPIANLSPLEPLAKDECIEPREVLRLVAIDLVALPILLALFAGWVMPRKES